MKILKKALDGVSIFVKRSSGLKKFFPVIEAVDEFFFGTDKTAGCAPYILDGIDIKRYMSFAVLGLLPAVSAGIYFYGLRLLALIAVSYIFGGMVETVFAVVRRKQIHEGFLVTGIIFPLILPPGIPLWMAAVGIVFGVFFGKEVFGGTGRNIFNPALVGRVFLSLAFPQYFAGRWAVPFARGVGGFARFANDAVTGATPLINFKSSHILVSAHSLLMGTAPGSIGETFRLGIIVGGLFLILTKISDWRIPFAYITSVVVCSFAGSHISARIAPPVFQVLSGGLLFGAFFMATDPVTAPLTFEAKWIYGILLGLLTVLIRGISGFVEGVMFAILFMNAVNPLIDSFVTDIKYRRKIDEK